MNIIASIIIPTHNRFASLRRLLESLKFQSFSQQNLEVIVVADGCNDETLQMLSNYKSALNLIVCELPGLGPAAARNKAASVANGEYLIFVDDDMEPSVDFIKEHIALHNTDNTVVIGYSPLVLESNAGIHRMRLREWWEEKFQAMRNKHYRFKYDDLTGGNFSVSSVLFKKVNGFDTRLRCREDYELGFRLTKAAAEFRFAYGAKAYHRDTVTDLKRSLQRKESEGISDIQIKKTHADFINKEAMYYLRRRPFTKSILLRAFQYIPSICDSIANFGEIAMKYFEKFKIRTSWWTMNNYLHQYWYLRGLMQGVSSVKELHQLVLQTWLPPKEDLKLSLDLEQGLKKAEEEIDQIKPSSLDIYYGTKFIGTISYEAGAESLKGIHLRKILKDKFSDELFSAIDPKNSFEVSLRKGKYHPV